MATKPQPKKPDPANEWKPYSNPAFEVNGLGQLRTKGHLPGAPTKPAPRKSEPVIEQGTLEDWMRDDAA